MEWCDRKSYFTLIQSSVVGDMVQIQVLEKDGNSCHLQSNSGSGLMQRKPELEGWKEDTGRP